MANFVQLEIDAPLLIVPMNFLMEMVSRENRDSHFVDINILNSLILISTFLFLKIAIYFLDLSLINFKLSNMSLKINLQIINIKIIKLKRCM